MKFSEEALESSLQLCCPVGLFLAQRPVKVPPRWKKVF
jgi:hypothetical protein